MLAGAPVERVGLLDSEAVAAYLRRLPQPVEVGASSAFQSTRAERPMRVFVNAVPLELGTGADVRDRGAALDAELEQKLAGGSAQVTDARGSRCRLDATLAEGSILRVRGGARRRDRRGARC